MEPIESKQFGSFVVEVYFDDCAEDPRTWGQGDELCPAILKQWQDGEVYGYVIKENGMEINSLWSIYSIEDCYETAQENFPTRDDQYHFDCYENQ